MKKENATPVLYVIVRNDLESMNSGKAESHSGHAASDFVYKFMSDKDLSNNKDFKEWVEAVNGFGTQINLAGNIDDIHAIAHICKKESVHYNIISDPTYPYVPPKHIRDGYMIPYLTRMEVTGIWFFGRKEDINIQKIKSGFELK